MLLPWKLIYRYSIFSMVLSMKQMGESMEGTELWTYLMPSAVAMEAYMAAQAEPYRMMQG